MKDDPETSTRVVGGILHNHKLRGYMTPKGPIGQDHSGPGLGGQNLGNGQRHDGISQSRQGPGLGGDNCGPCGTQGKY